MLNNKIEGVWVTYSMENLVDIAGMNVSRGDSE